MHPQDFKQWRERDNEPLSVEMMLACKALDLKALLADSREVLKVYRDLSTSPFHRHLFDLLISEDSPLHILRGEHSPPQPPQANALRRFAPGSDTTTAFRQLLPELDSLPDRDAIRKIVEIMAR